MQTEGVGRERARGHKGSAAAAGVDRPSEDQLLTYVELLFFAYRDFTSDPDQVLQQLGFGRAHHRVLHFVQRYPGLKVAELLQILKITKQSLARVLRDLVTAGHIAQQTGPSDRRERLLYTTLEGAALAERLARPQIERVAATLAALAAQNPGDGPHDQRDTTRMFLYHMITASERADVEALMARPGAPGAATEAALVCGHSPATFKAQSANTARRRRPPLRAAGPAGEES